MAAVAHVGPTLCPAETRLDFSDFGMRGQAAKHGGTKLSVLSKHLYIEVIFMRSKC
jgi:hypothetical protein